MTSSRIPKAHAYVYTAKFKEKDREATPQVKGEANGSMYIACCIILFISEQMNVLLDVRVATSDS